MKTDVHHCSICLEDINEKIMFMPDCSHVFHSKCFIKYIESTIPKEINCPICRTSVIKSFSFSLEVPVFQPPTTQIITIQEHEQIGTAEFINSNKCPIFCFVGSTLLCLWIYLSSILS